MSFTLDIGIRASAGGGVAPEPVMAAMLDGSRGAVFALEEWAPTSAVAGYEFGYTLQDATLPGAGEIAGLMGLDERLRNLVYPSVFVDEAGGLKVFVGNTLEIDEPTVLAPYFASGSPTIKLKFTSTELTFTANGNVLGTAATGWTIPTTAIKGAPLFIGHANQLDPGIQATIYDAFVTDLNSAANSGSYYLVADGQLSDGDGTTGWFNRCADLNALWASGSTAPELSVTRVVTQANVPRTYTAVTDTVTWRRFVGENGRRPYGASPDQVFYCSDTGNDSNDGLTPGTPKLTPTAVAALATSGQESHILFEYGSVFTENLPAIVGSGLSYERPRLYGAYGDPANGLPKFTGTGAEFIRMVGSAAKNYMMFSDLDFDVTARTVGTHTAASFVNSVCSAADTRNGIWIENCISRKSASNAITESGTNTTRNVVIRRTTITETCSGSGNAQGMFFKNCRRVVLDDVTINRSQRVRTDPGGQGWATDANAAFASALSHDLYVQSDCARFESYGLIACNGSSHGAQFRAGGRVRNTVCIGNAIGIEGGSADSSNLHGVFIAVDSVVVASADDIWDAATPTLPRVFGMQSVNDRHSFYRNFVMATGRATVTLNSPKFLGFADSGTGEASYAQCLYSRFRSTHGKLGFAAPDGTGLHLVLLDDLQWNQNGHPDTPTISVTSHASTLFNQADVRIRNSQIEDIGASNAYLRVSVATAVPTFLTDCTDLGGNTLGPAVFTDEGYLVGDFAASASVSPATEKGYIEALLARPSAVTFDTSIGAQPLIAAFFAAFDLD